ncbi:GntR family transcriptional regulator [Microbacterium sp. gxy059]|uniref:GntR family transcriptional regulator n=1 Tax=Microbacterium sp. gxy059 TaxID=2957199 RepID=UPI003D954B7E
MAGVSRAHAPASVFRVARTSTVDLIAIELRNAIYSGALAVGASLGEAEISAQLGVSRGPFREAAQRLVQEGLLTAIPGRGLRVSQIPPESVGDVYEARLAIEAQAVRRIVQDGRASGIDAIERGYRELVRVSDGDDAREIGDADLAFHQILVDAAGSPRLSRMMTTLVMETRIASFSQPDGYSVRRSVSPSYEALLAALRGGDAAAAVAALETQFGEAVARLNGETEIETVETDAEPEGLQPIEPGALSDGV